MVNRTAVGVNWRTDVERKGEGREGVCVRVCVCVYV